MNITTVKFKVTNISIKHENLIEVLNSYLDEYLTPEQSGVMLLRSDGYMVYSNEVLLSKIDDLKPCFNNFCKKNKGVIVDIYYVTQKYSKSLFGHMQFQGWNKTIDFRQDFSKDIASALTFLEHKGFDSIKDKMINEVIDYTCLFESDKDIINKNKIAVYFKDTERFIIFNKINKLIMTIADYKFIKSNTDLSKLFLKRMIENIMVLFRSKPKSINKMTTIVNMLKTIRG